MTRRNRVTVACLICAAPIEVPRSIVGRRKTCGGECKREWFRRNMLGNKHAAGENRKAPYRRGFASWNKGLRGIHLSPSTEFKPGHAGTRRDVVGTEHTRTTRRTGESRVFVKIAEPNKWRLRALVVWEAAHGPISRGYLIHHEDRNPLNDELSNLAMMTRAEHMEEHRAEHLAKKRAMAEKRLRAIDPLFVRAAR